jgi:hypothetical protein
VAGCGSRNTGKWVSLLETNCSGKLRRDTLRHVSNFIGGVVFSIASGVLDAGERDGTKARNVIDREEPTKAIDAVRRLERDAHARFSYHGVKVTSQWMLHRKNP